MLENGISWWRSYRWGCSLKKLAGGMVGMKWEEGKMRSLEHTG